MDPDSRDPGGRRPSGGGSVDRQCVGRRQPLPGHDLRPGRRHEPDADRQERDADQPAPGRLGHSGQSRPRERRPRSKGLPQPRPEGAGCPRLRPARSWSGDPVVRKRYPGIDIAPPYGTPIGAAHSGVVTFVGWDDGYGMHVEVAQVDGYVTTYSHMVSLDREGGAVGRRRPATRKRRQHRLTRPAHTCILRCTCPGVREWTPPSGYASTASRSSAFHRG